MGWSLLFIFLLYFSAPAYAAFSKLEVYTNIIGRDLACDPALAVHLGRARPDPDLRQERAEPRCGHRRLQGDPGPPGRPPLPGLRHQYGRDRALHAGDRGPSVRDLGSGCGRRSRRRALDRRRPAARHRQRAEPRHLLQDDPAAAACRAVDGHRPHPGGHRRGAWSGSWQALDPTASSGAGGCWVSVSFRRSSIAPLLGQDE